MFLTHGSYNSPLMTLVQYGLQIQEKEVNLQILDMIIIVVICKLKELFYIHYYTSFYTIIFCIFMGEISGIIVQYLFTDLMWNELDRLMAKIEYQILLMLLNTHEDLRANGKHKTRIHNVYSTLKILIALNPHHIHCCCLQILNYIFLFFPSSVLTHSNLQTLSLASSLQNHYFLTSLCDMVL